MERGKGIEWDEVKDQLLSNSSCTFSNEFRVDSTAFVIPSCSPHKTNETET